MNGMDFLALREEGSNHLSQPNKGSLMAETRTPQTGLRRSGTEAKELVADVSL